MNKNMDYKEAREMLSAIAERVSAQNVSLEEAQGRVLAMELVAQENVPAFDRSPYDGYAFRAKDSEETSREHPVTLQVVEEVPAGSVPTKEVVPGTAVKVLTGAPIPLGADAVVMYEKTVFTLTDVTLFDAFSPGDNIVYAGEDVKKGTVLAQPGCIIDPGLAGALAGQGIVYPLVYRKPVVGIISTGSEIVDLPGTDKFPGAVKSDGLPVDPSARSFESTQNDDAEWEYTGMSNGSTEAKIPEGKILNTNRYTLAAALRKDGCIPVYLGSAGDDVREIANLIQCGLSGKCIPCGNIPEASSESGPHIMRDTKSCNAEACENTQDYLREPSAAVGCDMILLTGGVSAGDYDLTPDAMELAGCTLLARGVALKPGMACCYGVKDGKLVCALSGNPSSSLTNYYAVVRPSVRKLTGLADYLPQSITLALANAFNKKSKAPRILKGKLVLKEGTAYMEIPKGQGNVMISSSIGCDCIAEVPAGSGPLEAGTKLEGFLV